MKTILNIVVMLWFASTTLAQQTQFDTDRSFGYLDSIGERLSIIQGDAFLNNWESVAVIARRELVDSIS